MPTKNNINYKYYKQFPKKDFEKNPWAVNKITRGINDIEYINLQTNDNKNINSLDLEDYRTRPCDYKDYGEKLNHPSFYYQRAVYPGHIGKCTVDQDSKITRSYITPLPDDKLSEIDIQFSYIPITQYSSQKILGELDNNYKVNGELDNNKFLLNTMPSKKIQQRYRSDFDRAGVNTRNFARSNDVLFKKEYNPYIHKQLNKLDNNLQ